MALMLKLAQGQMLSRTSAHHMLLRAHQHLGLGYTRSHRGYPRILFYLKPQLLLCRITVSTPKKYRTANMKMGKDELTRVDSRQGRVGVL